jgi:alpha-N-arabinofuranosidase
MASVVGWSLAALALGVSAGSSAAMAQSAPARFTHFTYEGHADDGAVAGPGQYRNPILPGYHPDPSILRVGDDYYLINSSFAHYPGIPIFHSKDLVSWRQIGNAIDRPGQLNFKGLGASRGVYAPDISYHDGLFYIINTCVDCGGNFVITAKNPAGPWSDPVWLGFQGIDPSIFWDGDKAYVVNNDAPNEKPRYEGHRAIWLQEFDYKTLKMTGPRQQIINGGTDIAKKPIWIEGPHMLRHGDWYYLYAAEGGTSDNHSEVVFRAKALTGPFEPYADNPILTQRDVDPARPHPVTSAGHAAFVQTQKGDWWSVFLATRPYGLGLYNTGRETFMLPVTWKDEWPVILGHGLPVPLVVARPKLGAPGKGSDNGDLRYVDDFTGKALSKAWIGLRNPQKPFYRLSEGALVLSSGAALGDLSGVPSLIARRQQHQDVAVSTTVSFTPRADGDRAGLVALQNDGAYLFLGLTRIEGKPRIALFTRSGKEGETLVASAPLPAGKVTLTYRSQGSELSLSYVAGGKRHVLKDKLDASFLSTKIAGGFVGTVVGPYAYYR